MYFYLNRKVYSRYFVSLYLRNWKIVLWTMDLQMPGSTKILVLIWYPSVFYLTNNFAFITSILKHLYYESSLIKSTRLEKPTKSLIMYYCLIITYYVFHLLIVLLIYPVNLSVSPWIRNLILLNVFLKGYYVFYDVSDL